MSKDVWLFHKGLPIDGDAFTPADNHLIGTYCYYPKGYYQWTQVIKVGTRQVWAKVALRNVPKKYRALLLLIN